MAASTLIKFFGGGVDVDLVLRLPVKLMHIHRVAHILAAHIGRFVGGAERRAAVRKPTLLSAVVAVAAVEACFTLAASSSSVADAMVVTDIATV